VTARRALGLGLLCGFLVTLGCVTPVTEQELQKDLERSASHIPNLGRKRVIPIYAETRLVARALLFAARRDPDSEMSALLGKRMAAASKRRISLVVGGPYPDLTEQVLANAMRLNQEHGLRGMKVVLVSERGPSPELARAAREARVRLYHHSYR
jgi:hypothetical protein